LSVFDFDDRSTPGPGSPACAGCTYCVQLALARFDHRGAPGLDPYLRRPIRSDACAARTEPSITTRDRHKWACMHACMQRVQSQNTYVQRVDGMESIRRVRACVRAARATRQQLAPAVERPRGRHWRAHMPCHAMPCIVWGRLRRAPTSLTTGRGPISSLQVSLLRLLSVVVQNHFFCKKKKKEANAS
jgi:hypothetical protein